MANVTSTDVHMGKLPSSSLWPCQGQRFRGNSLHPPSASRPSQPMRLDLKTHPVKGKVHLCRARWVSEGICRVKLSGSPAYLNSIALYSPLDPQLFCGQVLDSPSTLSEKYPLTRTGIDSELDPRSYLEDLVHQLTQPDSFRHSLHCRIQLRLSTRKCHVRLQL